MHGYSIAVFFWVLYLLITDMRKGGFMRVAETWFGLGWYSLLVWLFLISGIAVYIIFR